jgi:hypothetical protein
MFILSSSPATFWFWLSVNTVTISQKKLAVMTLHHRQNSEMRKHRHRPDCNVQTSNPLWLRLHPEWCAGYEDASASHEMFYETYACRNLLFVFSFAFWSHVFTWRVKISTLSRRLINVKTEKCDSTGTRPDRNVRTSDPLWSHLYPEWCAGYKLFEPTHILEITF